MLRARMRRGLTEVKIRYQNQWLEEHRGIIMDCPRECPTLLKKCDVYLEFNVGEPSLPLAPREPGYLCR
jgi:hypothetical protein